MDIFNNHCELFRFGGEVDHYLSVMVILSLIKLQLLCTYSDIHNIKISCSSYEYLYKCETIRIYNKLYNKCY